MKIKVNYQTVLKLQFSIPMSNFSNRLPSQTKLKYIVTKSKYKNKYLILDQILLNRNHIKNVININKLTTNKKKLIQKVKT